MNVLVKQQKDGTFIADRPGMSGSPIVGYGKTWAEAIGNLVIHDPAFFKVAVRVEDKHGKPFRFRPRHGR
jgi:hypothetical protein